jgi:hypothetical protein
MALPKIMHPAFDFTIPSTGKKESFRPFLVKEEKILLLAKASEDPSDIFRSMKQVVNNCALSPSFDVDKLAIFDLEYLFLRLRSVSVSNVVKVSYRDNEDGEVYDFEIDLKSIEVKFPENVERNIKINDSMGIVMKYPAASLFDDTDYFKSGDQAYYELILRCVDKIFSGEDVYMASDYTREDLEAFIDECGIEVFNKIQAFMSNTPRLYHKLKYINKNGNDRTIELTSLTDFFTLG